MINQTIAVTLDNFNPERIIHISRFGIENGYRARYNKNLFRGLDPDYKRRVLQKYHALCDLLEDFLVRGYDVHTTFLIDLLIPLWDLDASPYPCGKRVAAIRPDGSIGPCIRDHAFKTKTIFDVDPLSKLQCASFHFDVNEADIPDECRRCVSKTTCQGGCPHDKLVLTGTRSAKSVFCEVHREIIPRLHNVDELKTNTGKNR